MPFDERLAVRIRDVLREEQDVSERKMFGGLAFMVRGNMCCGIVGNDLMLRVGPDRFERALARKHARPMDFTGRPSKGMIYVAPAGVRTSRDLRKWIERALQFIRTLPRKKSR